MSYYCAAYWHIQRYWLLIRQLQSNKTSKIWCRQEFLWVCFLNPRGSNKQDRDETRSSPPAGWFRGSRHCNSTLALRWPVQAERGECTQRVGEEKASILDIPATARPLSGARPAVINHPEPLRSDRTVRQTELFKLVLTDSPVSSDAGGGRVDKRSTLL